MSPINETIPPKPDMTFGVVDEEKVNKVGKGIVCVTVVPLGQHGS
jgi:hypothetical protein